MPQPEEKQIIAPAVIAPAKMLEGRLPAMVLDPRHASSCVDVRPEGGVVEKRTGYAAFSIDISGNGDLSGRIQGLCQTPFGWTDDIVILFQNATNSIYYLYSTGNNNWEAGETIAQTLYSRLTWCPGVTSGGVEVVFMCDGKSQIVVWDDSQADSAAKIALHTANTTVLRANVLRYFYDHLVLFNVGEYASSWTQYQRKIQWMNATDPSDVDGGDAGANLLLGRRGGYIVGAEELVNDEIIYCQHEIIRMAYVGGTQAFRFDSMVQGMGLVAQNAICNFGDRHIFLADNYTVQEYSGLTYCTPIGDPVNKSIQSVINKTYYYNSFFVDAKGLNEAWLFIPTTTATPDTVYVVRYGGCIEDYKWYKYSMTAFAAMVYDDWYVLSGGIDLINNYNYSAKNDGSTAIDGKWDSIDFVNRENPSQMIRHTGVRFEAKGDEVSVYYSVDEGTEWTLVGTQTLTSSWAFYKIPKDTGYQRKVRYRFRNNTTGETFSLKWWQPVMVVAGAK